MSTTNNSELELAYQVRRALDESIADLPQSTLDRLSAARRMAIANKKPESAVLVTQPVHRYAGVSLRGSHNPLENSLNWLRRAGLLIPILILALGSVGIYQYEQERRIDDLAELDAAVLADELPIDAYLDHGFDNFLTKHGE